MMSKSLVLIFVFLNIMCHKIAMPFSTFKHSNSKSLYDKSFSENFHDVIALYAQGTNPKYIKQSAQRYENSYNVAATQVPKVIRKPNSSAAIQHELLNKDSENAIYVKYSYNYGVVDGNTGDSKAAWEERDGNTVRGEYSVLEADGSIRIVTYTADDLHGFNAVVRRIKPSRLASRPMAVQTFELASPYKRPRHKSFR
ncbi:PREDICTED: uncharacterized protein LOC105364149 [Ceratosolen solmsi marchali]|uniref:Uncharacterized protein LOC105364149 n=1 Tax=Ceratosolen solmsi marchali TaxID=326594 RepID=A0AAJ6YLJ4_9HYME|nr:PREDICTED: uncharacterized protein LOC105364149 [Ceratosolen solmsi marchali]